MCVSQHTIVHVVIPAVRHWECIDGTGRLATEYSSDDRIVGIRSCTKGLAYIDIDDASSRRVVEDKDNWPSLAKLDLARW
jgi:hypothetical protein